MASKRGIVILSIGAALGLVIVGLISLFVLFWFTPSGAGEYCSSPDNRYTAHADNMSVGTLLGGTDHFLQLRVVQNATGKDVCRVIYPHMSGANVPDYSHRGQKYITWAADSSSVTVQVLGCREVVLLVP